MTELQKVSAETMRFMRGKYKLDEVPGKYHDIDCLIFRQGNKTILTINICEDRFEFHIVYGKAQREKFDAVRDSFPSFIRDIYDSCLTYNNCKYMLIPVADLETLEAIKQMIMIKKSQPQTFSKRTGCLWRLWTPLRFVCSLHGRDIERGASKQGARTRKARLQYEAGR